MRILHLYSGNLFGGIETMLLTMARSRAARPALEPEFALCYRGRLWDELERAGAVVHHLGEVRLSRPATAVLARARLGQLLAARRYDAVLAHGAWAHALLGGMVVRARVPLVFWVHDALDGRHWTERLARRVRPDLAICNSSYTQATLPRLFPSTPSLVLHVPVDAPAQPRDADVAGQRVAMRRNLNTSETDVVIVMASRMEPWKGHQVLLAALASLADVPGWVTWIAGGAQRPAEAEYQAALQQEAARAGIAGRLRWLGERSDVPALLAAADIHCQPNTSPEPFGVAFVEALAARLPVVTSAFGGATEIVDASCGVLVEPRSATALADALERLIRDRALRQRLGAAGPERATRLCDPRQQLSRLAAALASLCAPRAVSA